VLLEEGSASVKCRKPGLEDEGAVTTLYNSILNKPHCKTSKLDTYEVRVGKAFRTFSVLFEANSLAAATF
jgi:hypothetical protein